VPALRPLLPWLWPQGAVVGWCGPACAGDAGDGRHRQPPGDEAGGRRAQAPAMGPWAQAVTG